MSVDPEIFAVFATQGSTGTTFYASNKTYSIDGMVEKPLVSAFQIFYWIENQLNI